MSNFAKSVFANAVILCPPDCRRVYVTGCLREMGIENPEVAYEILNSEYQGGE